MTDARDLPPLGDPIEVVPHDPAWYQMGLEARRQVLEVISPITPALVEHIGSTSVPGLAAKPVIDLLVSVMDFPLSDAALEGLAKLGFEYRGEAGIPGRQFFRTNPRTRHLHVFGLGHPGFERHMGFRSFLRAHPEHAKRYGAVKLDLAARFRHDREAYTNGKDAIIQDILERVHAWDRVFGPLRELQRLLANAPFRWCVAGGWALEVFTGQVERSHEDTDVIVYREDALALQRFLLARGWNTELIVRGLYRPWPLGEPLPDDVIQVHADHAHNTVGYLDFLLTPGDARTWVYRRNPDITRERDHSEIIGAHGIPALAPEIGLLFKAGGAGQMGVRNKDSEDFERVLPHLEPERRAWLRGVLEVQHPDHPWIARL